MASPPQKTRAKGGGIATADLRARVNSRHDADTRASDSASTTESDSDEMNDEDRAEAPNLRRRKRTSQRSDARGVNRRDPASLTQETRSTPSSSKKAKKQRGSPYRSASDILHATWSFLLDILYRVLDLLKTPLAFVITVVLILVGLRILINRATASICSLPGSSFVLSACSPPDAPTGIEEFHRLIKVHEELDRIQELAAGGASLPLFIKRGEAAIREVSKRVELSELPSRHALVPLFTDFHQRARHVGNDVQRFYSHLGRTYDMAIGITAITERRLQEIQALESSPNSKPPFASQALAIFRSSAPSPHALVRAEYLSHLERLKGSIDTLIAENEIVCTDLQALEDILYTIHDHATVDEVQLENTKRDLQSRFLALFKVHAPQLRRLESSLQTLDALRGARDVAARLFSGSLLQLRGLSRELEDLRVRIVEQEAIVEAEDVASLEYQVGMIHQSLDAMRAGKGKAEEAKGAYLKDLQRQIDASFHEYGDVVGQFYGKVNEALVSLVWANDEDSTTEETKV